MRKFESEFGSLKFGSDYILIFLATKYIRIYKIILFRDEQNEFTVRIRLDTISGIRCNLLLIAKSFNEYFLYRKKNSL